MLQKKAGGGGDDVRFEPHHEKTYVLVSDLVRRKPGSTATEVGLWLEISDLESSIYVAKTNALMSFVATAILTCVFVFAYAKRWFSHDAAYLNRLIKYWVKYLRAPIQAAT